MAGRTFTAFDTEILSRSTLSIAQGALTNSKRPETFVKGVYPTHLTEGRGAHVWDTKGNKYVDFICGLGSNLLGYAHEEITGAIQDQARKGATLSLGTELEVKGAERVKELFPFVDRVKFLKTGSDACSAALRIARSYRGREMVLSEGYHGWHDDFVSMTQPASGVPQRAYMDKLTSLEQISPSMAAVIVEPVSLDDSPARIEWLNRLREVCTNTGVLLIFDEVITGFRYPKLSVANATGVTPDLICLGKAMGGGMPLSAVAGKSQFMDPHDYFVSSTFAGETLSLAAGLKTMNLLTSKHQIDYLWEKGWQFLAKFNSYWPEGLQIKGYATRGAFEGSALNKALFWQEACKSGLLFGPSWFFAFPHIDLMDSVLSSCKDILRRIEHGQVKLEGEMPQTPFAQKARE